MADRHGLMNGLVGTRRQGKWVIYAVEPGRGGLERALLEMERRLSEILTT